jgi:mono/diheme cytochrome c family protein
LEGLHVSKDRLPQGSKKKYWAVNLALLVATCVAFVYFHYLRPEVTAAMRGEEVAREFGCFACHGGTGISGISNPGSVSGDVPSWVAGKIAMYVIEEQDFQEWILYGVPRSHSSSADYVKPASLIPMPAYEKVLSGNELEDLVEYLQAVSGWAASIPNEVYEGRKIGLRLGCFGCHGPSGMGGVWNPGSLKNSIPPWTGEDFEELVRDTQELREWILDGRIKRLWKKPLARYFLERQIIQMPAYREYLSDEELEKLVTYVRWLRKE